MERSGEVVSYSSFYAAGIGTACGAAMVSLSLLTTWSAVEALPARAPTLCAAREMTLFACPIGRKLVAVCSAGKQPVYRYGTPGKIELETAKLTIASTGYSGGGEQQITASNGAYSYTVYGRAIRTGFKGHNNPQVIEGLIVRENGRTVSSRTCDRASTGAWDVDRVIPEGSFVEAD